MAPLKTTNGKLPLIIVNNTDDLIIRKSKMAALNITKEQEAEVIANIASMAAESLSPDDYEELESILNRMCATRSIKVKG